MFPVKFRYLRKYKKYENYNVGVPFAGKYKEIFNSDDKKYGGNGVVNTRVKAAKKAECDEREYSITLKLPALVYRAVDRIRGRL